MKKQSMALLIELTVMLSGVAGFGGTYLANALTYPTDNSTGALPLNQGAGLDMDADQFTAYLEAYLADNNVLFAVPDTAAFSATLLNSAGENTTDGVMTIPEIAALASNSIVEIYTETVVRSGRIGQFVTEGAGSGVIITASGYVVTNNHVIEGARKITVRLRNGLEYEAALIGRDSKTDLAVVKINAPGLQPAVYGDSDKLAVGELAVAIGNPLGTLGGTVSEGIISALGRNIDIDGHAMNLMQTTAAVNPGNSGGGLFNCYGQLVGVVNAKSSGSDIEGIGFAIPANMVKTIVDALIQYGYVPGRIDFGANLVDILDTRTAMLNRIQTLGVYVIQADADSNLKAGDRIISIGGKDILNTADVKSLLETHKVGDVLSVIVSRGGQNTAVEIKLKQATS